MRIVVEQAQALEDVRRLVNGHNVDLIFASEPGAGLVPAVHSEVLFTDEAGE